MTQVIKYEINDPYLNIPCLLGEGPHYDEKLKEFRFLDITKKQIHFIDVTKSPLSLRTIDHPEFSIGVTADIEGNDDEFIFAGEYLYGIMNKHTGKHRVLKNLWDADPQAESHTKKKRMNDGNVDSQGRFWAGTMNDPAKHEIHSAEDSLKVITTADNPLFRLDPDLTLHRVLEGTMVPNGTSWTIDNKTMYWTDSGSRSIYAFDYNADTAAITNQRTFWRAPGGPPMMVPDGHAMDVEEHLWVAMYGGGKVIRLNPNAEIVAEISLPATLVSCPCFVGEELWVTTIGTGENIGEYAGALFKVHVGVKGKPKNTWEGRISTKL